MNGGHVDAAVVFPPIETSSSADGQEFLGYVTQGDGSNNNNKFLSLGCYVRVRIQLQFRGTAVTVGEIGWLG